MFAASCARKWVSWIACFAFLLASLAPTIANAMRSGQANGFIEICTAVGAKLVHAEKGANRLPLPAAPADHAFQHCPYCSLHVTTLGMPPAPPKVPLAAPLAFGQPLLVLHARRTLFAWVTAQPRGPPVVS